jgi:hypothetical protein
MDAAASGRPSRERDFLDELQRQRDEASDGGAYPDGLPTSTPFDDEAAAVAPVPRVERSVGSTSAATRPTTYDADDLEIPSFLRRK